MRRCTDAPPDQRLSDPIDGMSATKPIARPGDAGWASRCSAHPKPSLLHRLKCHVCVPGDVDLITRLDLIKQRRIRDTPAVLPVVRTGDADRLPVLVDIGDG